MAAKAAEETNAIEIQFSDTYLVPKTFPETPTHYMSKDDCAVIFDLRGFLKRVDFALSDEVLIGMEQFMIDLDKKFFDANVYFDKQPSLKVIPTTRNTVVGGTTIKFEPFNNNELKRVLDLMWVHFDKLNDYFYLTGTLLEVSEPPTEDVQKAVQEARVCFHRTEPRIICWCLWMHYYYYFYYFHFKMSSKKRNQQRTSPYIKRKNQNILNQQEGIVDNALNQFEQMQIKAAADAAADAATKGVFIIRQEGKKSFLTKWKRFTYNGVQMFCMSWLVVVNVDNMAGDHIVCYYAICANTDEDSFARMLNKRSYVDEASGGASGSSGGSGGVWSKRLYCIDANELLTYRQLESLNVDAQTDQQVSGLWSGICLQFSLRAMDLCMKYCERLYGGNAIRRMLMHADDLSYGYTGGVFPYESSMFPLMYSEKVDSDVCSRFQEEIKRMPFVLDDSERLITTGITPMKQTVGADRIPERYNGFLLWYGDWDANYDFSGIHTLDLRGVNSIPDGLLHIVSLRNLLCPPVLEIKAGQFAGWTSLQFIGGLQQVTTIGKSAFDGCVNLEVVQTLENCTKICRHAFWGCEKLHQLKLPVIKTFWNTPMLVWLQKNNDMICVFRMNMKDTECSVNNGVIEEISGSSSKSSSGSSSGSVDTPVRSPASKRSRRQDMSPLTENDYDVNKTLGVGGDESVNRKIDFGEKRKFQEPVLQFRLRF